MTNEGTACSTVNGDSRRKNVIWAQIGSRQHYQPAEMMANEARLACLITDGWNRSGVSPTNVLARALPPLVSRFLGRRDDRIPPSLVRSHNALAIEFRLAERLARSRRELYLVQTKFGKKFAEASIRHLRDIEHDSYFGFCSGSLEALKYERGCGRWAVLDQYDPARTEERVVCEEMQRHPNWALYADPIPDAYYRRQEEEWSEASSVLVNSDWSKQALVEQGVPNDKIVVVPLPFAGSQVPRTRWRPSGAALRVLWLGTLCLRKGLVYAVEAARALSRAPVQFTFVGPLDVRGSAMELPENCRYLGHVPRTLTAEVYSSHDVFLLPTLSDGFALTQVEAMAYGLPVIATACCGAVVEDGISGFIVPPGDPRSIVEALEALSEPGRLEVMSAAASARAKTFGPREVLPQYIRALHLL